MKQLFELVSQLEPPWRVVSSDFDFARRRVELCVGFRTGSRLPCRRCGRACQAVAFTEGTWDQPDMMAFEVFVTARLPSVRRPKARERGP
jgi:transposase